MTISAEDLARVKERIGELISGSQQWSEALARNLMLIQQINEEAEGIQSQVKLNLQREANQELERENALIQAKPQPPLQQALETRCQTVRPKFSWARDLAHLQASF